MITFQIFYHFFLLIISLAWVVLNSQGVHVGNSPLANSVDLETGQNAILGPENSGSEGLEKPSKIAKRLVFTTAPPPDCGPLCRLRKGKALACDVSDKCSLGNYGLAFISNPINTGTATVPCCGECNKDKECCNLFGQFCTDSTDCCNSTAVCESTTKKCCSPYGPSGKCERNSDCCNGVCIGSFCCGGPTDTCDDTNLSFDGCCPGFSLECRRRDGSPKCCVSTGKCCNPNQDACCSGTGNCLQGVDKDINSAFCCLKEGNDCMAGTGAPCCKGLRCVNNVCCGGASVGEACSAERTCCRNLRCLEGVCCSGAIEAERCDDRNGPFCCDPFRCSSGFCCSAERNEKCDKGTTCCDGLPCVNGFCCDRVVGDKCDDGLCCPDLVCFELSGVKTCQKSDR